MWEWLLSSGGTQIGQSYLMENSLVLPIFKVVEPADHEGTLFSILTPAEVDAVPEEHRPAFLKDGEATHTISATRKVTYLTLTRARKATVSSDVAVRVSAAAAVTQDYQGSLSDLLGNIYRFDRKSKRTPFHVISLESTVPHLQQVISLAEAQNRSREWANGRGDVEAIPAYFLQIAEALVARHPEVNLTVIRGKELLEQGFRLMHAVGRASVNEPIFVNLAYRGDPNSEEWVAFVGKGVCFDTGGYNIKSTSSMRDMFLDKHGATSVLAAFQAVVEEKLPINLTCSMGLVENFINENAYRPSDIIVSRKGLTVEIGNTDAEGRLVLADEMHWVQEKYRTRVLIELSTLTGAIVSALGSEYAGLFTNDQSLYKDLRKAGEQVHEMVWKMPCSEYHKEIITPKSADLNNSPGRSEASPSQAAAFLKCFVEEGTKWVHLDIAGTAMGPGVGTGYGARLLIQYARSQSAPKQ